MTTTIWSGLAVGAVYALVAIGYNIVLLASGVFNFAHAQLIMLGAYMAFVGAGTLGLPVLLVIPFAALFGWHACPNCRCVVVDQAEHEPVCPVGS